MLVASVFSAESKSGANGFVEIHEILKLSDKYNSYTIVVYQNILGFVFFLPVFLISRNYNNLVHHFSISLLMPVVKLAVFGSLLAFILFINTIRLTYSLT